MKKLKGSQLSTYSKHLQKLAQNYCRTTKLRKQNSFCMRKELKREIVDLNVLKT